MIDDQDEGQITEEEEKNYDLFQLSLMILKFIIQASICLVWDAIPMIIHLFFIVSLQDYQSMQALLFGFIFSQFSTQFIILSLQTRVETMVSYAYGQNDQILILLTFQRAFLMFCVAMIPILILFMLSRYFFLIFLETFLAYQTAEFVLCLYPSVVFFGLFTIMRSYLFAQQEYALPFLVEILILPFIVVLDKQLIVNMDLKLTGVALSQFIIYSLFFIFLTLSTKLFTNIQIDVINYKQQAFTGWLRFMNVGYPLGGGLFIDFITVKILSFYVINLEDELQIKAYSLIQQVAVFFVLIQTAIAVVITNIISNFIVKKQIKLCYNCLIIITLLLVAISFLEMLPFYISFEKVARIFLPSEADQDLFFKIFESFVIITVLYNFVQGYAAYLRAIGQEEKQFLGYLFIHIIITIPLSYILTFPMNLQLNGVLLGNIIGVTLLMIFFCISAFISDLSTLKHKIQKMIDEEIQINQL